MKIQIYYNKNYLPFNLYINSLYNILKNNEFFITNKYDVSIINNTSQYSNDADFLILFLNYIEDIYNINTKNTKVIFIHADYIINYSKNNLYLIGNYINNKNFHNSYLWEYNYLNIDYYNKNFINKKCSFIPLQYNIYLEKIYNNHKLNIPYSKKPIDILFMGSVDPRSRRDLLLEQLRKKYEVFIMNNVNDIEKFIGISKEYNIFELQNAISNKNLSVAMQILNYFEHNHKAAPIQMALPALYSFFSKVYAAYGMSDKSESALKSLFYNNFSVVKQAQATMRNYGYPGVEKIMLLLNHYNLKGVGIGDSGTESALLMKEMTVKMILAI